MATIAQFNTSSVKAPSVTRVIEECSNELQYREAFGVQIAVTEVFAFWAGFVGMTGEQLQNQMNGKAAA